MPYKTLPSPPQAVSRGNAGVDRSEMCPIGRENVDSAGAGCEQVAVLVDFQFVAHLLKTGAAGDMPIP